MVNGTELWRTAQAQPTIRNVSCHDSRIQDVSPGCQQRRLVMVHICKVAQHRVRSYPACNKAEESGHMRAHGVAMILLLM